MIENFTPVSGLIGGLLIGLAATLLLLLNGRLSGISGIVDRAASRYDEAVQVHGPSPAGVMHHERTAPDLAPLKPAHRVT